MIDNISKLYWYVTKGFKYPEVHKIFRELKEENELTPEQWMDLCYRRLRKILVFAGLHVPYYRRTWKQIGFDPHSAKLPDDLERLPVLTKEKIRENLSDLIADNVHKSQLMENASGGSTGVPLKFFKDRKYWSIAEALDIYVRHWWDIKPYDRTAFVWGADRDFGNLSARDRFNQWRSRVRGLNAFRMNEDNLREFCQMLSRWQPSYLMGYSSALEALARYAFNQGINNLTFKAVRSTAEMLYPDQRELIQGTFHSPVYNFYGSREINNIAAECREQGRLHLISTWRYVELTDDNGRHTSNGELGYVTITDLSCYSMPFIRYRNEDVAKMDSRLCRCKLPSPVIKEILGRSTDIILTPRGDMIHGEYFTHLFYGRNDIIRFQLHQTALDHLLLRYVPIKKIPSDDIKKWIAQISSQVGGEMRIDVEEVESIPVPPSGKHRFTISDVGRNILCPKN